MSNYVLTAICGCSIAPNDEGAGNGYELTPCALHGAAPELLVACKAAQEHLRNERQNKVTHPIGLCPTLDLVDAAIAKAEERS